LVENGIKTVGNIYPESRAPGVAILCFQTCNTFAMNVLKDSTNDKFKRINLENEKV
jgi:hypothetical protein